MKSFLNEEQYLQKLNEEIDVLYLKDCYPKIWEHYKYLRITFKNVCAQKTDSVFQQMRRLLQIDAQLQIIHFFFKYDQKIDRELFLKEEELLKLIVNDKDSYYREITGMKNTDLPPIGLIYISEK